METAVDAHATRLLLHISPPEACFDSSLGPYVTSVLRESLAGAPASRRDAIPDLVELLESHCQISSGAAREVLSSIALAVQTGDVPDVSGGIAQGGNGSNDGIGKPATRSRSKSLGAEPAYDVQFLGKILRDNMITRGPPRQDTSYSPLGDPLNIATDGTINNCIIVSKKERIKQRSVTFDETCVWRTSLPKMSLTPFPYTEGILEEHSPIFEPLEGILGVLDLEGDDEPQTEMKQVVIDNVSDGEKESETEVLGKDDSNCQSSGANRNNLCGQSEAKRTKDISRKTLRSIPPKHQSRKMQKPCKSEADDLAAALFRPSRPRSNSLMERKTARSHQSEADDLAASLFRPSRPRSNSHVDQRQRPLSPALIPQSLSPSSSGVSAESSSSSSSGPGKLPLQDGAASKSDISSPYATRVLNNDASHNDSVEFKSTVQLLLTLNSHLGHEAASLATKLTDGDLNLAQYLIETARSDSGPGGPFRADSRYQQRRSRLCRHELRGTCYRADCPYSHDFSGVTCLFWLKGRCREGNCRFLHGFAESLLEGICKEYLVEQLEKKKEEEELKCLKKKQLEEEEKNKIHTTNLLDHNQWSQDNFSSSSLVPNRPFASSPPGNGSPSPLFGNGCWTASIVNQ